MKARARPTPSRSATANRVTQLYAAQVDRGEEQRRWRSPAREPGAGQKPLMDGGGREERGQAAGRNPSPPVADAGEVGEDRTVGPECLGAGGGDAADAVRDTSGSAPSSPALPPSSSGGRRSGAGRPRCPGRGCPLPDEERRDQEQALIASAHGERRRSDPAHAARVGSGGGMRYLGDLH